MFIQMYEEKYMRFPEGRTKAVTFSYDDGVKADKKLIEIFDQYGLKGTFNLNSELFGKEYESWHGRMDEEETYKTFANCGHEIALHGARHIFMDKVPLPEAISELVRNRGFLEKKFARIISGMAYAYNSYNDSIVNVLSSLGINYARTTQSSHGFEIPRDWLRLKPTCHHGDERLKELTHKFLQAQPEAERKMREPLLFFVWGHSFEFDESDNWHIIKELAEKLSGRKEIWYATNGEIYDYVKAYNGLIFSMDGERVFNPSHMPVWLEIRSKVYKIESGQEVAFN